MVSVPAAGDGHLGVDLVGRDLDERLVDLDRVADLLEPLEDRAFGHRFAHLGHGDLRRSSRGGHPGSAVTLRQVGSFTCDGDVQTRRRKHLGLGLRGPAASPDELREAARRRPRAPRLRARGRRAPRRRSRRSSCRRRGSSRRPSRWPRSAATEPYERAVAHLRQGLPRHRARAFAAASTTRPTWSPTRATRPTLAALLDWCAAARRRGDPVRRRHRVVGGVEPPSATATRRGVDRPRAGSTGCSRSTRSRAPRASRRAPPGPALEEQLRPHGLTLRHFPQSFEFSTLGGWIATRSGGHYATLLHPHRRLRRVDARRHAARRLGDPAAARLGRRAEPGPDAARLRGHPRRDHRGVDARAGRGPRSRRRRARALRRASSRAPRRCGRSSQSGLYPANCRLLDPGEAALTGAAPDGQGAAGARLRVGRPPARRRGWRARSSCCADHGGESPSADAARRRSAARGGAWRDAFLQAPYLRDALIAARRRSPRRSRPRSPGTASTRSSPRCASAPAALREVCGAGRVDLPLHPRLPRRPGAVLHGARARAARLRARAVGRDQGGRLRGDRSPPAARSRTTTPSAATTGPGTTASARSRSPPRCAPPSARSTRRASSTPAC